MDNRVLLVSNRSNLVQQTKDKITDVVNKVQKSGRVVTCFYEDIELFKVLYTIEGVVFLRCLSSGADKLLFEKNNLSTYSNVKNISIKDLNSHPSVKRSLTRYPVPNKDDSFDEEEHVSRRLAVCYNRLNFVVSNVYKDYQFIVHFKDSKVNNLLRDIKPAEGDGKFIYEYDCITFMYSFSVGGLFFKEEDFNNILKEV